MTRGEGGVWWWGGIRVHFSLFGNERLHIYILGSLMEHIFDDDIVTVCQSLTRSVCLSVLGLFVSLCCLSWFVL